jgi:dTDP-4-dehydrorhamnose 3,5-epimerase
MKFTPLPLAGACLVEPELAHDGRGAFARTFCRREFAAHGLETDVAQTNVSFNPMQGTIRGLHWQAAPHEEAKLVRCTHGAAFDAIVDLRRGSPTFGHWHAVELSAANRCMLYVPKGFAHGFQTVQPDTELFYLMSEFYVPEAKRGVRWDDPTLAIAWPMAAALLSEADRALPLLAELAETQR